MKKVIWEAFSSVLTSLIANFVTFGSAGFATVAGAILAWKLFT